MNQKNMAAVVAVGLSIVLTSVGGFAALGDSPQADSPPHSQAIDATDPLALTALTERVLISGPERKMSEFQMATNPLDADHILLGAIDFSSEVGGWRCASYVSLDGGRSWTGGMVAPLLGGSASWDPWVGFGPLGDPHFLCLWRAHDGSSQIAHLESSDGGVTWFHKEALPSFSAQDRVSFMVDSAGRLQACFATAEGTHILTSSADGWSDWPLGFSVYACNGFVEQADGTLVAVASGPGAAPGQGMAYVLLSSDGGTTWSQPIAALSFVLFRDPVGADAYAHPAYAYPTIGLDPITGAIAVAAQSVRDDGLLEAKLAISTDGAASFVEQPIAMLPTDCTLCHVEKPLVSFMLDGMLGIQVLLRNAAGAPEQEVWLQSSPDIGASWLTPLKVATATMMDGQMSPLWLGPDARPLVGDAQSALNGHPESAASAAQSDAYGFPLTHHDGGDYWATTVTTDGFLVTWIDAAHGGPPALWTILVGAA